MKLQSLISRNDARKVFHCVQRTVSRSSRVKILPDGKISKRTKLLHQPVMVREVLNSLYPQSGDVILDMTFGAGGHTRSIMEKCNDCTVIALDRDPVSHDIAQELSLKSNNRLVPLLGRFSQLKELLLEKNITAINGALIDAGCSSMQFDVDRRGFSLSRDGPLDMRMDGNRYPDMPSAADVVNRLSKSDLSKILEIYGEEKHCEKIAQRMVDFRENEGPITSTKELAHVVASAFSPSAEMARKDSLDRRSHISTKTFMAIRIFVNDEMNEIYKGLKVVEDLMVQGGRLVTISFHSLEDRIVKRVISGTSMKKPFGMSLSQQAAYNQTIEKTDKRKWMFLHKQVVLPQFEEVEDNNRSRSAKLRSATRI